MEFLSYPQSSQLQRAYWYADTHCSLEKSLLVGPITALCVLDAESSIILAEGMGPVLLVYDLQSGDLLLNECVLDCGVIFGIKTEVLTEQTIVLIFGEKRICMVTLRCSYQEQDGATEKKKHLILQDKIELEMKDWIFDAIFLPHESVLKVVPSATTSSSPTTLSSFIAVGYANNFIEIWNWKDGVCLHRLACEEKSLLYSISLNISDEGHILIASGTIFNQILIWNTLNNGKLLNKLNGHEGVIFKLKWSKNKRDICSASDDRSVRLWKDVTVPTSSSIAPSLSLYGHDARVWDCVLLDQFILSSGEDSKCCAWNYEGVCVAVLYGHKGKNGIRSLAVNSQQTVIVTAGSDSAIKLWSIPHLLNSIKNDQTTYQLPLSLNGNVSKQQLDAPRCIRFLANDTLLCVLTEKRYLYTLNTVNGDWKLLSVLQEKHHVLWSSESGEVIVLGDNRGTLNLFNTRTLSGQRWTAHDKAIAKFFSVEESAATLQLLSSGYGGVLHWWFINKNFGEGCYSLFATFIIGKQSTNSPSIIHCVAIDRQRGLLVCGDYDGAIHLFAIPSQTQSDPIAPIYSLKNAHEKKQRVSHLLLLYPDLFSVGRDGHLAHCRLVPTHLSDSSQSSQLVSQSSQKSSSQQSSQLASQSSQQSSQKNSSAEEQKGNYEVIKIAFNKVSDMETLEAVFEIEGQLFVVGFAGPNVVLFNFSSQFKVLEIKCGGYKRSNDFKLDEKLNFTFAYLKEAFIYYCSVSQSDTPFRRHSLQLQFHGTSSNVVSLFRTASNDIHIITGSEDTSLMSLSLDKSSITSNESKSNLLSTKLKCDQILEGHTSGVKCIAISTPKKQSVEGARVMFSAGGSNEIKRWKILHSEGSLCFQPMPNLLKKNTVDMVRILALVAFPLPWQQSLHCVITGRSDAQLHVFLFDETTDKLELCAIGSYHTAAILSLDYMTLDDTVLICSGSSDGRVFIAEIATLLHSLTTADVTKSKDVLKLSSIYSTTAHQVGVNCIKFIQSSSGSTHELVSAGDDQKLYTMRFSLSSNNGESQIHCLHTFEIRIAQNAAITALAADAEFIFTCGADQRLHIWKRQNDDTAAVTLYAACVVDVSDVLSLDVLKFSNSGYIIAIVGAELELLKFNLK